MGYFIKQDTQFMTWMRQALLNVFRLPVKWLVKTNSIPSDVESELGIDKSRPIIYLLPSDSVTDQLALQMSAQKMGLPDPVEPVTLANKSYPGSLFLRRTEALLRKRNQNTDIEPVFTTWGRAPGKGKPGLADLLTLSAAPSWLRKFFIVLFLGRDTFISYSQAVSSRAMADQHSTDEKLAHKLSRVASTHFYRKRQAMTGPTLLERQELNNAVLGSEMVRNAIGEEMRAKKLSADEARQVAAGYLTEIAA